MTAVLIHCSACGDQMSSAAKACPKCGNPMNSNWFDKTGWVLFWLVIFMPVGIYGMYRGKKLGFFRHLFTLFIIAIVVALFMEGEVPKKVSKVKTTEPAESILQGYLVRMYEENEVAANSNYKNKVINVTGKLESVEQSLGFITANFSDGNFVAYMDKTEKESIAKLETGEWVTLTCLIEGKAIGIVNGTDCIVVPTDTELIKNAFRNLFHVN